PAAATTTAPAASASATAARTNGSSSPAMDRLTTFAPSATASWMPAATSEGNPTPSSPSTLIDSTLVLQPIPATPVRLLVRAATVPATWVPWPFWSDTVGLVLWFPPTTTLPARPGWVV